MIMPSLGTVCHPKANIAFRHWPALSMLNRQQFYYHQWLQEGTGNQGLKWHVIRELLHSDERKQSSSAEASKLCSSFSLFLDNKLSHIAGVVRDRLASTSSVLHPPITRTSSSSLSYLDTVTATKVADVIRLLPQKSSPLDVITVSLLKLSTDIMSPLIARFANLSFTYGVFPSRYKAARVTHLLKKPNLSPHEPANYRPISNLCTFPKYQKNSFCPGCNRASSSRQTTASFSQLIGKATPPRQLFWEWSTTFRGPLGTVSAPLCWRSTYR